MKILFLLKKFSDYCFFHRIIEDRNWYEEVGKTIRKIYEDHSEQDERDDSKRDE